jgi:hypothetical protein
MLVTKVTFDHTTDAPNPRYLAAGMQGDNHSRLVRFDVPLLTDDQLVFVKIESGSVSDKVRLYPDGEGLYCWTISHNALLQFGDGGQAQVEVSDPGDPLDIVWQSGVIALTVGASVDVDTTISKREVTLLGQIQADMQRVEAATKASEQAAAGSAAAAAGSAGDAAGSASAAAGSADEAARSADEAAGSAASAAGSADRAAKSVGDAAKHVASAQASATSAAASAEDARKSADEAAQIVTGDLDTRYVRLTDYTAAAVLGKVKAVDGSGSGLDADLLDGKQGSEYAAKQHTHAQGDVTGLSESLSGKADKVHTHGLSDVTGLDEALSAKADKSHKHAASDIQAGALGGKVVANTTAAAALAEAQVRNIKAQTANLTAGTSPLANGEVVLVYE